MVADGSFALELLAGLLADAGALEAPMSAGAATEALTRLTAGPVSWEHQPGEGRTNDVGVRTQVSADWSIGWVPPDPVAVAVNRAAFGQLADTLLQAKTPQDDLTLRVRVHSLADYAALQAGRTTLVTGQVAPHLALPEHAFRWRWPLQVGSDPRSAAATSTGDDLAGLLFHPVPLSRNSIDIVGDPVEIALLDATELDLLDQVSSAVAVVVGVDLADAEAVGAMLDRAVRTGRSAVLLVPDRPADLIAQLTFELAHDQPLDVVVSRILPDAVLAASDGFLPYTSVRSWAADLGRRLAADPATSAAGAALRQVVASRSFSAESQGTADVVRAVSGVDRGELDRLTHYRAADTSGHAPDPAPSDPHRATPPITVLPGRCLPRTLSPVLCGAPVVLHPTEPPPWHDPYGGPWTQATPPPPPDDGAISDDEISGADDGRRLQVKLTGADPRRPLDRFVAGQRHQLRIRIAAEVTGASATANRGFRSPTPDRDVDLTVTVTPLSWRARPLRRTLRLPAGGDSAWTRPVPVDVPADAQGVTVAVVVLHQGRTVQSAILTGQLRAGTTAPVGLTLEVDVDTPVGGLSGRSPASTTLMLAPGQGATPTVIDLSRANPFIRSTDLDANLAAIRALLRDGFSVSRPSLRAARPLLVELALVGRSLHDRLAEARMLTEVGDWVHVLTFGAADLPLELIYDHPQPTGEAVPICPPARRGATSCPADCATRQSGDVVCPFGFWGTSKVVERRRHSDGRRRTSQPATRKIEVAGRTIVGVSTKADQDDSTATARILAAVTGYAGAARVEQVADWEQLRVAVRTSASVLVLVTHTVADGPPSSTTGTELELGGVRQRIAFVNSGFVNPDRREPGPIVFSLGCDTDSLRIGFGDWVGRLQSAGAEVVVSTLSPVPGREVADFVERTFAELPRQLAGPGTHRWGAVMTAVRCATIASGDPLALALTAWGDGDVELVGAGTGE